MLIKETVVFGRDNSGCSKARVIQVYTTHTHHLDRRVRVVLTRFDPRRNLKAKKHYHVLVMVVTRLVKRFTGVLYRFSETCIVFMAELRKRLLGSRIDTCVMREALTNAVFDKTLRQKVISLSSFTV